MVEKRAKIRAWVDPPLIRAMPERKLFFFIDVFPNKIWHPENHIQYILKYRYNISGFVEELPQLPENKGGHACAALPTGVRPAQHTFSI